MGNTDLDQKILCIINENIFSADVDDLIKVMKLAYNKAFDDVFREFTRPQIGL